MNDISELIIPLDRRISIITHGGKQYKSPQIIEFCGDSIVTKIDVDCVKTFLIVLKHYYFIFNGCVLRYIAPIL